MKLKILFLRYLLIFVTTLLTAQNNYSLLFDGVDDYVGDFGDVLDVGTSSFTISAWINIHNSGQIQTIISKWDNDSNVQTGFSFTVVPTAEGLKLNANITGGVGFTDIATSNDTIPQNIWTYATMVVDRTNNFTSIFIDGVEDTVITNTFTYSLSNTGELNIGSTYNYDSSIRSNFIYGSMDEIRFWQSALTENAIQSKMSEELYLPNEDDLIGFWNCNEGNGQLLTDFSGNLYNGTVYGALWNIDSPIIYGSDLDSLALIALYNSTDGDNWTNNTNWKTGAPIDEWYGVAVGDNRVLVIDLHSNLLAGEIPEDIGNLTYLQQLQLSYNQLIGSIPISIDNLNSIFTIQLNNNLLTGVIPASIGNLPELGNLVLKSNNLSGLIPPEIGNVSSLVTLYLDNNNLSGNIPEDISNLNNLRYLFVSNNQLTGVLPEGIGYFADLIHLKIDNNELTGTITESFINLINLQHFHIQNNRLFCYDLIPSFLLDGTIPVTGLYDQYCIEQDSLALVALYNNTDGDNWLNNNNWLTSVPIDDWFGVTVTNTDSNYRVTLLDLSSNSLTGEIPDEIGNLSALNTLNLPANNIMGIIPTTIGNIQELEFLHLNNNVLTGQIPSEIALLNNLISLRLYGNNLTGSIPQELGELSELGELTLHYNNIVGQIPHTIGNLLQLNYMDLSRNSIGGSIPSEIGELTNLTYLSIGENNISGEIPSEIGNLINLQIFSANANNLTGNIPVELGNCASMRSLGLGANFLTGTIPPELGDLSNLLYLGLGRNILEGIIPSELGYLTNLRRLDIYTNNISGIIPVELSNILTMERLFIEGNELIGSVPEEFISLTSIIDFRLYGNHLFCTDPIPEFLLDGTIPVTGLYDQTCPVFIHNVSPQYPTIGDTIIITGVGLSTGNSSPSVYIDDVNTNITDYTNWKIEAIVPDIEPGIKDVLVITADARDTAFSAISILQQTGSGIFCDTSNIIFDHYGSHSHTLHLNDYDNDSDLDILSFSYTSPSILVNSDLSFSEIYPDIQIEFHGTSPSFGDISRNGFIDYITQHSSEQRLSLFNNSGTGITEYQDIFHSITWLSKQIVIDLDKDGYLDILLYGRDVPNPTSVTRHLNVLYGGESNDYVEENLLSQMGMYSGQLITHDLNNDGHNDIILSTETWGPNNYFMEYYISAINESGYVLPEPNVINLPSHINYLNTINLNNDNYIDLILQMGISDSLYIYRNIQGEIDDNPFVIIPTGENSVTTFCADFNNDNYDDIILFGSGNIFLFANNQGNGFSTGTLIYQGLEFYNSVNVWDYDNDGDVDIIYDDMYGLHVIKNLSEVFPPVFTSNIPDTSFNEDDSLVYLYSELYLYVDDGNDPDSLLQWSVSDGRHLSVNSSTNSFTIIPEHNWFGIDTIVFYVFDPDSLTDSSIVELYVRPINDPPSTFAIISPLDSSEVDTLAPLLEWEVSFDPDPLDTVRYALYFDTPDPGVVVTLLDTITSFQFVSPLLDNTTYYWKVVATDLSGATTENTGGYHSFRINTMNDLPESFTLLSPENESMVTDLTPTFNWTIPIDPDDGRQVSDGDRIKLNSTTNRSIATYNVFFSTDSTFAGFTPVVVTEPVFTPSIDLIEDNVYYWKVEAVDEDDGITTSDIWSFWTNNQNSIPSYFSVISPINSIDVDTISPTFTWHSSTDDDLNDIVVYYLYLGESIEDIEPVYTGIVPWITDTTFTLIETTPDNTTYYWNVVATDLSGATRQNEGGFQTFNVNLGNEPPSAVDLISPDSVIVLTQYPEFHWTPAIDPDPQDHVNYELHWRMNGDNFVDSVLTDTNYAIAYHDLTDNAMYSWWVLSMDTNYDMSESGHKVFWIDSEPEAPLVFNTLYPPNNEIIEDVYVTLLWENTVDPDPLDVVDFSLLLSATYGEPEIIDTIAIGVDTSYTFETNTGIIYFWKVAANDGDGMSTYSNNGEWSQFITPDLNALRESLIPDVFALHPATPNPFNPTTRIRYDLPEDSYVRITVYDLLGRQIINLVNEDMKAGYRSAIWNGTDTFGKPVSSGMYIYQIQAGSFIQSKKMLLLK